MADCEHKNLMTECRVALLEDTGRRMAEIKIRCLDCGVPFRFMGLPAGLDFDRPTVSIDGVELNAPVEPETEKRLASGATYRLPPELRGVSN